MTRKPYGRAAALLCVLSLGMTATLWNTSAHAALGSAAPTASRGIDCGRITCGRVFIVAIGYNGSMPGGGAVQFAESDARAVAQRAVWEWTGPTASRNHSASLAATYLAEADTSASARERLADAERRFRSDSLGSVFAAVLTGDSATRANVQRTFAKIAQIGRPQDILVVYYGGINAWTKDQDGVEREYLQLAGSRQFTDSAALQFGVSAPEFGSWLGAVSIERQLIITEAGDGTNFIDDFGAGLVERNEVAQQLMQRRKRILLGPRRVGLELGEVGGGLLSTAIRRMPVSMTKIWSHTYSTVAALEATVQGLYGSLDSYVGMFDERSFLGISRRLSARSASNSRGGLVPDAVQPAPPAAVGGRNIALLIGTDRYVEGSGWNPLRNPIYDVTQIAKELADGFSFDTLVLRNPTRDQMLEAILTLAERTYGDDDQVLVFIAGHGQYDERLRMGHLVASDSRALSADRLRDSYISHGQLASYLDAIPAKHLLAVLDACFGGAFADLPGGGSRSGDEYDDTDLGRLVRQKLEHQSRLYITSGGTEYVPDGRPGQHSPFARRFIATLRDARASSRVLTFAGLRAGVESAQPGPRAGEFGSNEPGGDFVLIPASRLTRR